MSLQLTGTVKEIGEEITGSGANGQWKKRTCLLEYKDGDRTKQVEFQTMNRVTERLEKISEGETATIHFSLESRDYNGKRYTNASAYKIETA